MKFPLNKKPENDYASGGDSFGAQRWTDKNKDKVVQRNELRLHAGCDLYSPEGTEVYAMESGKVWIVAPFYLGTSEIAIRGARYTIRYGEIEPLVKKGMTVKEGQLIGKVKKCTGIKQAMLHLEMYDMPASSFPLTDIKSEKAYLRRSDLINPTEILLNLQKNIL